MKKVKPLNDFILIRLSPKENMIGNIIIPDSDDEKGVIGEVVEVGRGIYNYHTDSIVPHEVKVGDQVVIPKLGTQKITVENVDYYICQANQLLGKIENE